MKKQPPRYERFSAHVKEVIAGITSFDGKPLTKEERELLEDLTKQTSKWEDGRWTEARYGKVTCCHAECSYLGYMRCR